MHINSTVAKQEKGFLTKISAPKKIKIKREKQKKKRKNKSLGNTQKPSVSV